MDGPVLSAHEPQPGKLRLPRAPCGLPGRGTCHQTSPGFYKVGFSIPLVNKRSGVDPPICKSKPCFVIPASRGVTDAQDAGNETSSGSDSCSTKSGPLSARRLDMVH